MNITVSKLLFHVKAMILLSYPKPNSQQEWETREKFEKELEYHFDALRSLCDSFPPNFK